MELKDIAVSIGEIKQTVDKRFGELDAYKVEVQAQLTDLAKRTRPWGGHGSDSRSTERKAVDSALRKMLRDDDSELKQMQVGVDPLGGYSVLPHFSEEVHRVMLEISPMARLARTVEISSGVFEELVDINQPEAQWVGETQARPTTDTPNLGLTRIEARELYAMPEATQTLIDDSKIDIIQWLSSKVAEQFAAKEDAAFFTGGGITTPRGLLTYDLSTAGDSTRPWGTFQVVKTGVNGGFAASDPADHLIELVSKLKAQYRVGATFLMNRNVESIIRKWKSSTSGEYLLTQSLVEGQPNRLLGYPVEVCESMPDPATGALPIAFGNVRRAYTIVRRLGQRMLVDPFTNKPFVRLYVHQRVGGGAVGFDAVKFIQTSA